MDTFDWQTLAVWLIVGAAFIVIAGRFVLRRLGGSRRSKEGGSSKDCRCG